MRACLHFVTKLDKQNQHHQRRAIDMQIFTPFQDKLNRPLWHLDPELALFDTILVTQPQILALVKDDVLGVGKNNGLGRQDSPSVEQVLRAAIYKEVKGLSYEQLEYHQYDSKIGEVFLQVTNPFSKSTLQKYVVCICAVSLKQVMQALNQVAVDEGLEDLQKLRMDTTVTETDIHYPTNNGLLWDGIRTTTRILKQFDSRRVRGLARDYRKQAKKNYFKLNVTKDKASRKALFTKQLRLFSRCVEQIRAILIYLELRSERLSEADRQRVAQLKELQPHMKQIHDVAYRREILDEAVAAEEKLFSLYERHTQMIVKGKDKVLFGRKVSLASGRSNLILDARICEGESDGATFEPTLKEVIAAYQRTPRDVATDGAYASAKNQQAAKGLGIVNIVFNKVVGSLRNIASSQQMETRLKKWRSGMEGVISNIKRGFNLRRCLWKGEAHFEAKVFWSVIGYNLRVMSSLLLQKLSC
jgi:IS5 family transposase